MTNANDKQPGLAPINLPLPSVQTGTVLHYEFQQLDNKGANGGLYHRHCFILQLPQVGDISCQEYSQAFSHELASGDKIEFYLNKYNPGGQYYVIRIKTILEKGESGPGPAARLTDLDGLVRPPLDEEDVFTCDEQDLQLLHAATLLHQYRPHSGYSQVLTSYSLMAKRMREFRHSTTTPFEVMEWHKAYREKYHQDPDMSTVRVEVPGHSARVPLSIVPMGRDEFECRLLQAAALLHKYRPETSDEEVMETFSQYTLFFQRIRGGHKSIYES